MLIAYFDIVSIGWRHLIYLTWFYSLRRINTKSMLSNTLYKFRLEKHTIITPAHIIIFSLSYFLCIAILYKIISLNPIINNHQRTINIKKCSVGNSIYNFENFGLKIPKYLCIFLREISDVCFGIVGPILK